MNPFWFWLVQVRGIRKAGPKNTVTGALRKKTKRLNTPEDLPTYIVVVEFGEPHTRMAIR